MEILQLIAIFAVIIWLFVKPFFKGLRQLDLEDKQIYNKEIQDVNRVELEKWYNTKIVEHQKLFNRLESPIVRLILSLFSLFGISLWCYQNDFGLFSIFITVFIVIIYWLYKGTSEHRMYLNLINSSTPINKNNLEFSFLWEQVNTLASRMNLINREIKIHLESRNGFLPNIIIFDQTIYLIIPTHGIILSKYHSKYFNSVIAHEFGHVLQNDFRVFSLLSFQNARDKFFFIWIIIGLTIGIKEYSKSWEAGNKEIIKSEQNYNADLVTKSIMDFYHPNREVETNERLKRLGVDSAQRKIMNKILNGTISEEQHQEIREEQLSKTRKSSNFLLTISILLILLPSIIDTLRFLYGIPLFRKKSEFLADTASLIYSDYESITFVLKNFVRTSEEDSKIHPSPQQRINALTVLANSFLIDGTSEKQEEKSEFGSEVHELEVEENKFTVDIKESEVKSIATDNQLQIAKKMKARKTMIYGVIWFAVGVIGLQLFESSFSWGNVILGAIQFVKGLVEYNDNGVPEVTQVPKLISEENSSEKV